MSGNVVDFEDERAKAQQKRAKALQRRAEAAQRTLDEASDIREALRNTARTENQDRAILAANLARMCKEATRDDKASVREIFKTAFDQGFDAKYKKLKRFVCAPHDEPPKEGFAAHGADLVALAEGVAMIAQEGRPADAITQAKKRSILQLIEGSSFDKKRTPEARRRDEAIGVLLNWMDQVIRNIETEVDLDAPYDAIKHASAAAVFDADGNASCLAVLTKEWPIETIRNFGESTEDFEARSAAFRFSLLHPTQQHLYKVLHGRTALDPEYGDNRVASQLLRTVGPNDVPFSVGAWDLTDPDAPELTREAAYAPFAPRAVLGEILSPAKRDFEEHGVTGAVTGVVMLDIDEREIGGALAQQAHEYENAVSRYELAGIVLAFN